MWLMLNLVMCIICFCTATEQTKKSAIAINKNCRTRRRIIFSAVKLRNTLWRYAPLSAAPLQT
jgi:hypothetical protein